HSPPPRRSLPLPYTTLFRSRVTLSAGVSDLCTEPGMLPQAYEQANCSAKQSAFVGHESVYFFSQMQKERPAGMPYFDTEQVEKRSEEHTSELQSRLELVCRL